MAARCAGHLAFQQFAVTSICHWLSQSSVQCKLLIGSLVYARRMTVVVGRCLQGRMQDSNSHFSEPKFDVPEEKRLCLR